MKKGCILFYLIIFCNIIHGQINPGKNCLKCSFLYKSVKDSLTHSENEDLMLLFIEPKGSAFYSYYTFQADSIKQEPDYEQKWKQAFMTAIQTEGVSASNFYFRRTSSYIYKKIMEGKIQTYDDIDNSLYVYEDSLDAQVWTLGDSTKMILDYTCDMATTFYHGRNWVVWFTYEIPVSNGPWKLGGLPGLIMEAYDTKRQHHFTINGIQQANNIDIYDRSIIGKFKKTTRKSFLKAKRNFDENSAQIIQSKTGINIGLDSSNNALNRDYLEIDYKN